jgi:hypothetical protein
MKRVCEPEILDSLPFGHPDAVRNRRDLRLINLFMRNGAWLARTLGRLLKPGEVVLELGSGTGEMGLQLISQGVALDGLDLWPRPKAWPEGRLWHQADLKSFSGFDPYGAVVGNLILHQFTDAELAGLGARIRRSARVVIACEPARRRMSQRMIAAIAPLFGANYVTLHDARVSVAAGFAGDELPLALGLDAAGWSYSCSATALGAIRMVAVRNP